MTAAVPGATIIATIKRRDASIGQSSEPQGTRSLVIDTSVDGREASQGSACVSSHIPASPTEPKATLAQV
ncbi:hypothetical protein EDD21DRAFT_415958 [Dissophora ornata]|nr:hypothetical protein EDD21DRAFT_415958 [Dissophora ornata]